MTDYIFNLSGDEIARRLSAILNKVDKVDGKGLSTEDFTSELLAKLKSLNNYNDAELRSAIESLQIDFEDIREGANKGATALQSVPEEYITESELDAKGYAVARNVANALATKVTAVTGKGLSTEDFTTALKTKLETLSNYDDSQIAEAVAQLRSDIDTLVSGNTTKAIESFNEIIAFLEGVEDSESLGGIIAAIEQQIAGKQDTITDLEDIRAGASKGAKAVRKVKVNGMTKTPDANGIIDLGNIEGGSGSVDLSNYYTKEEVNRSVGDLEDYTNEELNKKVGKGDIIPAESIGAFSNAANGSATSAPIIGNRIPYLKADAFAFLNPDEYTIEYSVDGVDWEMADSNTVYSRSLFAGYNFYNSVPIDPSQRQFQVGSKIRITMYPKTARNAHIDVIAINMYCNGRAFDIEGEYCAKSNDTPQWQSMQRSVSINSNGVCYFQYNNKFAFEAYKRWGIRLTFTITKNTAYGSRIQGIMGYGNICSEVAPNVSTAPYTLGTLWFWDYLKNITFPAAISATSLSLTEGNSANLLRGNGGQIAPTALTLDFTQLDWYKANTQSISNGMWQVLAPYIPTTKGNRLAFLGDEEFKVEYSTDSGVTWSEAEKTLTMRNVFSGRNNGYITVKSTTTDQMRITITPNSNRYCMIDFFYFWVGSPSEGNTFMDVEFSTGNAPDTWSLHVKDVDLRGLTGANMVKYKRLLAHSSTGVANVRFTIRNTKDHSTNTSIQGISGYGTKVWGNMSNMFLTGDIYSWDSEQNALFPAKIKEGDKWLDEKYALKSEVGGKVIQVIDAIQSDGITLSPNTIHVVAYELVNITISGFDTTEAGVDEYALQFLTSPTSGKLNLPSYVRWANGIPPTLEGGTLYELSVVRTNIAGADYFKAVLTPFK